MPFSIDPLTKSMELVQCRETTADAALKWGFFVVLVSLAVSGGFAIVWFALEDWRSRRKVQREGLRK